MKNNIRRILVIATVVIMSLGIVGCGSDKSEIKDTLTAFETACKSMDINGILKCIDPKVSDPIRLGMAIFSSFSDTDYDEFVETVMDAIIDSGELDSRIDPYTFLNTLSFTEVKMKPEKNIATGTCKINFEVNGEKFSRDAEIEMIKKDEKWYISDMHIISE